MEQGKLLDIIKEKHGIKSDYMLAKFLKVNRSSISQWRSGVTNFDAEHAKLIAELSGVDKGTVASVVMAIKAKDTKTRKYWEAACVCLMVGGMLASAPTDTQASSSSGVNPLYIMRNWIFLIICTLSAYLNRILFAGKNDKKDFRCYSTATAGLTGR